MGVSFCVVAALSLAVHDVMLTRLGIPFPDISAVPGWARLVDASVRVAALVWLCRIARPVLQRFSLLRGALLIGTVLVLLNETLRVFVVSLYLTHGWLEGRWLFTLLDRLPGALTAFAQGAGAIVIASHSVRSRKLVASVAVLALGGIATFVFQPAFRTLVTATQRALALAELAEITFSPTRPMSMQ